MLQPLLRDCFVLRILVGLFPEVSAGLLDVSFTEFEDAVCALEPTSALLFFDRLANPILTAVYDNCLPGDKCSIIACQKQNGTGDILRFSQPLDGLLLPGGTFFLF
jgi:hypothetical protein